MEIYFDEKVKIYIFRNHDLLQVAEVIYYWQTGGNTLRSLSCSIGVENNA